jgi:hypothetical protein
MDPLCNTFANTNLNTNHPSVSRSTHRFDSAQGRFLKHYTRARHD